MPNGQFPTIPYQPDRTEYTLSMITKAGVQLKTL